MSCERCEYLEERIRELREDRDRTILKALEGARLQIRHLEAINESLLKKMSELASMQPPAPIIVRDGKLLREGNGSD